jgi:hypothetical protein
MLSSLIAGAYSSEHSDPVEMVIAIVVIIVILVILYLAREKRFKSKYNPSQRHKEDIRDWGGTSGGKPIGDPRNN